MLNGIGVYVTAGVLADSAVVTNWSTDSCSGAGVLQSGGVVSNCTIVGNRIVGWHQNCAGVYQTGGLLVNCIIARNSVGAGNGSSTSGGVKTDGGTVRNCLIFGNIADTGGGLYLNGGLSENCTVVGNQGRVQGGGVYRNAGAMTNGIVRLNTAPASTNLNTSTGVGYSCAPELTDGTNGNLTADPFFMAMGAGYGTNATLGNYQLQRRSPCANAGTNRTWMTNAVDLAGDPRIKNDIVDMGAYEVLLPPSGTVFKMR